MTEPASGRVAQLTPEEWKQLVLLNTAQLQNFINSIPGASETGASGLTDQHMALIEGHLTRGRSFMRAWSLARVTMPQPQVAMPADNANGADTPKKGGWPKGKKRTPRASAADAAQ